MQIELKRVKKIAFYEHLHSYAMLADFAVCVCVCVESTRKNRTKPSSQLHLVSQSVVSKCYTSQHAKYFGNHPKIRIWLLLLVLLLFMLDSATRPVDQASI